MTIKNKKSYTVKGACPQDCPDTCAMIYHVEDGELVKVTGNPDQGNRMNKLAGDKGGRD